MFLWRKRKPCRNKVFGADCFIFFLKETAKYFRHEMCPCLRDLRPRIQKNRKYLCRRQYRKQTWFPSYRKTGYLCGKCDPSGLWRTFRLTTKNSIPSACFYRSLPKAKTSMKEPLSGQEKKVFSYLYYISFQKLTVKNLPRNKSFSALLFLYVWKICAFYF